MINAGTDDVITISPSGTKTVCHGGQGNDVRCGGTGNDAIDGRLGENDNIHLWPIRGPVIALIGIAIAFVDRRGRKS